MSDVDRLINCQQDPEAQLQDIAFWTNFFFQKSRDAEIFVATTNSFSFRTKSSANVIGNKWLQFSTLMPKVLCLLAGKVDSNQARMRILKIAWEELGEGRAKHIHAETFKACLSLAEVEVTSSSPSAIDQLERYAEGHFRSTSEIFGLGLGLEIVAIQNIETVFQGLAYDPIVASHLRQSEFFQVHFLNEEGHIQHCIESFMKYCPDKESQIDFLIGFENGLNFWKSFWSEVAEELKPNNQQEIAWAN